MSRYLRAAIRWTLAAIGHHIDTRICAWPETTGEDDDDA